MNSYNFILLILLSFLSTASYSQCGLFINLTSGDTHVCPSGSTTLNAEVEGGTPPYSYSWSHSKTLSDSTISNPIAFPVEAITTYVVTVTDSDGCTESTDIIIYEALGAGINITRPKSTICKGDTAFFNVFLIGAETVQWTSQGISDPTSPQPYAVPTTTTQYFVNGYNSFGCTSKDSITITIIEKPEISAGEDIVIYEAQDVQLNATATGGVAPYRYEWPYFETSDQRRFIGNPSVFVSATTEFVVQGHDANLCLNLDTMKVILSVLPSHILSGIITTSSSDNLGNSKVYLLAENSINEIKAIDSTITNSSGFYSFNTSKSQVWIKAVPNGSLYPDELPVYYPNALFIESATLVNVSSDIATLNIQTIPLVNQGGSGQINGVIVDGTGARMAAKNYRLASDFVTGLKLFLLNMNGDVVSTTVTNASGYFEFTGLQEGIYIIVADAYGVDNSQLSKITITSANNVQGNLSYVLESTGLKLQSVTSINNAALFKSVRIFPNPFTSSFTLEYETYSNEDVRIEIVNLYGQIVSSEKRLSQGSISYSLNPGVYYVKIFSDGKSFVGKVIRE